MVMSYKGAKVPKIVKTPSVLVKDYMARRLITFKPYQSMYKVVEVLIKYNISGGPVVNDEEELVGVLSEGDCLKEVVKGKYHNMPILSGLAEDYMVKEVLTVSPDINIFEVAKMFLEKRLRRFPVVENKKLVGQISQKDVMKAVLKIKSATW